MLRSFLIGLAAALVVGATVVPDEALAFRGGGRGGGGFHGGAVHAGRGYGVAGRAHIAGRPGRPIAGRPGYPGRPIAGYPGRYYPGAAWRGAAYGAAAVGAAAAGAYGYYGGYNNGCYRDTYGNLVCPNQYQY